MKRHIKITEATREHKEKRSKSLKTYHNLKRLEKRKKYHKRCHVCPRGIHRTVSSHLTKATKKRTKLLIITLSLRLSGVYNLFLARKGLFCG